MGEKLKGELIGFSVILVASILSFLAVNYFGSFETKAASKSKFTTLDNKLDTANGKLDRVICHLNNPKSKCLIIGK